MSLTKIKQNEDLKYNIYIIPQDIDLSKTDYPDGFVVSGMNFDNKQDAEEFRIDINHFLECMLSDAKETIQDYLIADKTKYEIIEEMIESSWTHPYYSYSEEAKSIVCELNFLPPYMDLEKAGFSHGFPILNKQFFDKNLTADTEEINDARNSIDKIMTESFKTTLSKILDEEIETLVTKNNVKGPSL